MESDAIFYRGSVKKNRSKVNKKARGLGSPRSELYTARYSLEDDLPNELHAEGLAGSNAGSAEEVTRGIVYQTETGAGGACPLSQHRGTRVCCSASRADGSAPLGEVNSVSEVIHLRPQLDFQPFGDGDVLEDGKIHVRKAWSVELVAGEIATESSRSVRTERPPDGHRERRRIPPLVPSVSRRKFVIDAFVRITDQVQAQ